MPPAGHSPPELYLNSRGRKARRPVSVVASTRSHEDLEPRRDPVSASRHADTRDERARTRRRNVLVAQHHREQGWSFAEIARLLDRAPATVKGYLHDPSGEKAKARKAGYAGRCERCGAPPAPTARIARRAATAHRLRAPAAASHTCTSPGPLRATARAPRQRHVLGQRIPNVSRAAAPTAVASTLIACAASTAVTQPRALLSNQRRATMSAARLAPARRACLSENYRARPLRRLRRAVRRSPRSTTRPSPPTSGEPQTTTVDALPGDVDRLAARQE